VRVFTVGIGSRTGEPIPTYAADGTWTGYQRDEAGEVVTTRMTEQSEGTLRRIAEETHGTFVRARPGSVGMGEILSAMKTMKATEQRARRVTVHENRYALALLPGLLLLLIEAMLPEGLPRRRRKEAEVTA
jgi:Ca-activated chloride channel family protein